MGQLDAHLALQARGGRGLPARLRLLERLGLEYVDALLLHWPGPEDLDLGGDPGAVAGECKGEDGKWFDANVDVAFTSFPYAMTE